ncbi:hypothetical protein HALA3H3_970012 [Halomonas sp. A3H3]|nr:hypothetical protein HALA3H3_970012 [Halomonas sp. A3H3]|tara:strand:+ start:255 stop:482 length:228 start_codon:yes stop_codon:yes gene_type:complete
MAFALHTSQWQAQHDQPGYFYPEVSLAQAREKRADKIASQGIVPVEQKQDDKRKQQYSVIFDAVLYWCFQRIRRA